MEPLYFLTVRSKEAATVTSINDVPLVSDSAAEGVVTDQPLNLWLMPGENVLSVFLRWPRTKEYVPGKAEADAHVYLHDAAQDVPTPAATLARATWPLKVGPEFYPSTIRLPFILKAPLPTTLWSEAEVVKELTDADRRAIRTLAQNVADACKARDVARIIDLQLYKWEDMARAEYKDFARVRGAAVKQFEWLFTRPALKVLPLHDGLTADLAAGGRLALLKHPEGRNPVILEDGADNVIEFPIYAARIKGTWKLVR